LRQDLVPTVRHVLELSAAARRPGPPPETGGQTSFHYVIGNDVSFVGPLVEHLENNLPAWTDPDRLRISMALSEALINAIHHGNLEVDSHLRDDDEAAFFDAIRRRRSTRPYAARRVRIEAEFTGDEVRFCITDEGRGFDHSQVGDPTQADKLLGVGGRGLLLIRSLMDETQHNPQGNQITLVKRRGRRSPAVHPD
jgi:anti-sigma regulatory factor (Ser/Thr protein kinase)